MGIADMGGTLKAILANTTIVYYTSVGQTDRYHIVYPITQYWDEPVEVALINGQDQSWVLSDQGETFGGLLTHAGFMDEDLTEVQKRYISNLMARTRCSLSQGGAVECKIMTNSIDQQILGFPAVLLALGYLFLIR